MKYIYDGENIVAISDEKLIFVYNADEGVFNALMDTAHKLFAPSTYQCNLCALTHGVTSMKSEWKNYMSNLNYETRFYHREGFMTEWPSLNIELPAILLQQDDQQPKVLMGAQQLNEQQSLAQLMAVMGRMLIEHKRG